MTATAYAAQVGKGSLIQTGVGVVIVHKVNRKNYVCYDEAGNGWNIQIASQKPLPTTTAFDKGAYLAVLEAEEKLRRDALNDALACTLVVGSLVEFVRPQDVKRYSGKYVVISAVTAKGHINVAKLGGDNNRYVTTPLSTLREVAP